MTANWNPESPAPNYATDTFLIGSGFTANANTGNVTAAMTLEGTLLWSLNNAQANNLILNGGSLASNNGAQTWINNTSGQIQINDADAGPGVTTSYVSNSGSGTFYFYSRLNAGTGGSGNLDLARNSTGNLILYNSGATGGTWAGNMSISAGRVELNGIYSLANGTLNVDADELDISGGFATGIVNVATNGVANIPGTNIRANELRLSGGTIKSTGGYFQNTAANAKLNLIGATTSYANANGNTFYLPQLNGSGDLVVTGNAGTVRLWNSTAGNTYTGTVTVASGGTLRMEHANGLSGGTIDLDGTSGTFQLGAGLASGTVNVKTGGIAQIDAGNTPTITGFLRLQGGTLRNVGSGYIQDGSKLYVDSGFTSTITDDAGGQEGLIRAELIGSGNLIIDGLGRVQLGRSAASTSYTGSITIASGGTLRMENANGLSGGTINLNASSGVFQLGAGIANGTINVGTGATVQVDAGSAFVTGNLRLQGGTLRFTGSGYIENTTGSKIYVDNGFTSSITDDAGGQSGLLRASLIGNGDLLITGLGDVALGSNALTTGYTGTIRINTGSSLRMEHVNGLSGGTIELDATSGTFNLGPGIANGAVHAGTGGTIRINNDNATTTGQLRLDGGTLATPANGYIGSSSSNVVYVDSASNLNDTLGSQDLYLPTLSGSGKLTSIGAGVVRFWNNDNRSTFSGDWDIQAGKVYVDGNAVSFSAPQLGSGAVVNIGAGASLEFADEGSDNKWDLTKTLTGNGTVKHNVHDGLIIHRNAADTIGGISPGTGDGAAGIISFDMGTNNATPFTFSTLDFAKDGTGGVQWHIDVVGIGGVAGTDYDQIRLAPSSGGNPNAWLRGLDKVNLVVDVGAISGDPGTITIFTGADNTLAAMTFGTQTWLNNYFGDVIYGVDGTIKLTNIVAPVLWEAASGDWSEGAKWSPDGAPGVTTLTSVNNGGTSTITGNESTKTLFVQYANSAVNIQSGGSLNVALNMEVQTGASATVAGGLTTPILSTSGTTTFNSGATGAITNLNVGGGTTTFNAWGGTVTNMTVSGGALSVADGVAFATSSTAVSGGTVDFGTGSSSSLGTLNVFAGAITSDRALSISTLTMTGGSLTLNNGVSIAATSTARNANIAITGSPTTMGSLTVGKTTNNVAASLTIQDTSVTATTIDIRTDGFQGSAVLNTAPTLGIDNSTVNVGTLRIGANQAYDVRGSITDSTVNVSTNLFTQGNGGGGGTAVLTVGAGGVLNLLTNSSAWSHSTANGYLNLVSGGQFNVTGTVDLTQVRSGTNNGTAWNGGIVRVGTQLTNFNNQQLDPGNILDMSTTGTFGGTVGVDRLYLRGGTIKFGAGYARDSRLQLTEDLGLIEVAGGALTNMPNTVSASVTLDGAAATWTTGNKTFGEGTILTLANGAATTTGIGNVLNLDQLAFEGTGGKMNMNNSILVHGANQLSLRNNGWLSGSGQILVGTDGLSLGDNGNEGLLDGTGAGFTVYGDISGWGALGGVTLYGNYNPGSSPGHATVLAGGLTLTPGVSTYEIGGTDQSNPDYDYTTLIGTLTIQPGVTLDVVWWMGFEASAGDVFELFDLQGGGFNGTFSTLTLPTFTNPNLAWDSSALYTTGEISVFDQTEVAAVPEPSTLALSLLSLIGLVCAVRRRHRAAA